MTSKARQDSIWAIASYFNPSGYRRRFENYKAFRAALNVPLVTAEVSFGQPFQLAAGDADVVVQVADGDVMFQKERLLNIAMSRVPEHVENIAWIDCDLVLDAGWDVKANEELQRSSAIQLFSKFYDVPKDVSPQGFDRDQSLPNQPVGALLSRGIAPSEICSAPPGRLNGGHLFGVAWAARADIIRECGFYDACVVGNGDRAMAYAALGEFDRFEDYVCMNENQRSHYRAWAERYHRRVDGNVGFIDSTVCHLWHGDLKNRGYRARHSAFSGFEFDPSRDITSDEDQAWRWTTDKPEMHNFLTQYFESRREDGLVGEDGTTHAPALMPSSP